MEKLKQYSLYLVIPAIILIAFSIGSYRSKKEAGSVNCKFNEITLESVKNLPGGEEFDAETVRQVNEETPYCRDLCQEQLDYSKKYSDWFAEDALRKTCADLGINLPVK